MSTATWFTNDNGLDPDRCCGQVAVATVLSLHGIATSVPALERRYPPNVLFGRWGTSKHRLMDMLEDYGLAIEDLATDDLERGDIVLLSSWKWAHWCTVRQLIPGSCPEEDVIDIGNWGVDALERIQRLGLSIDDLLPQGKTS